MRTREWIRPKLNRLKVNLSRFTVSSLITRPLAFVDKVLALRDLTVLQNVVMKYCPPIVPPDTSHSWFGRITNVDFLLYRAIIAILDGKKTLATLAIGETSNKDSFEARELYARLLSVQDSTAFDALVAQYRQIGKLYGKGTGTT